MIVSCNTLPFSHFTAIFCAFLAEDVRCNKTLHGPSLLILDITSQKWIYTEEIANPSGNMGMNQSGQTAGEILLAPTLSSRPSRDGPAGLWLHCGGEGKEELSQPFTLPVSL